MCMLPLSTEKKHFPSLLFWVANVSSLGKSHVWFTPYQWFIEERLACDVVDTFTIHAYLVTETIAGHKMGLPVRFWKGVGVGGVLSTFKHWFLTNRMRNWVKNSNVYVLMDRANDSSLVWFPFNLHLLHMTVRWLVLNAQPTVMVMSGWNTFCQNTLHPPSVITYLFTSNKGNNSLIQLLYYLQWNSHWITRSVYISNHLLQWNSLTRSYICLHLKPLVTMK